MASLAEFLGIFYAVSSLIFLATSRPFLLLFPSLFSCSTRLKILFPFLALNLNLNFKVYLNTKGGEFLNFTTLVHPTLAVPPPWDSCPRIVGPMVASSSIFLPFLFSQFLFNAGPEILVFPAPKIETKSKE